MRWPLAWRSTLDDVEGRLAEARYRVEVLERSRQDRDAESLRTDAMIAKLNGIIDNLRRERVAVLGSLSDVTQRMRSATGV